MNAFSAALALCIPLLVLWLGAMMRHAHIAQNQWIGYRTRRAMQSEEAWAFAQKTAGRLWMAAGAAMLCVSAVLCVLVYPWMETAVIYICFGPGGADAGNGAADRAGVEAKVWALLHEKSSHRAAFLRLVLEEHIAVLRMAPEPESGVGAGNTGLSAFKAQLLCCGAHQPARHPCPCRLGWTKVWLRLATPSPAVGNVISARSTPFASSA